MMRQPPSVAARQLHWDTSTSRRGGDASAVLEESVWGNVLHGAAGLYFSGVGGDPVP